MGAAEGRLDRVDILGVSVVAGPFDEVVEAVVDTLESPGRDAHYLCPTGVHGIIEAQDDDDFRGILNRAAFNVADGMPLVRVAQMRGHRHAERAFGPDVMLAVLSRSAELPVRHFFYGGRDGVAEGLATRMPVRFPGLQVAGWHCPPFRPLTATEEDDLVEKINGSDADAVWVGLSTPKQEKWVESFRSRLKVKMLFSVGAAFDYHTGSIKGAPQWMKSASLEWLYRLGQDPGRLWRRYATIVPRFLWLMTLDSVGLRRRSNSISDPRG